MFAQIMNRNRQTESPLPSGPSKAELCKQDGCKCYCHEAVREPWWLVVGMFILCVGLGILAVSVLLIIFTLEHPIVQPSPPQQQQQQVVPQSTTPLDTPEPDAQPDNPDPNDTTSEPTQDNTTAQPAESPKSNEGPQ